MISRVLYIDSDTIILDDVSALLTMSIEGRAAGAVKTYSSDLQE